MTTLKKPVARMVRGTPRGDLRVVLTQHAVLIQEKGRRGSLTVPLGAVLDLGYRLEAREGEAARAGKARGRRRGRQTGRRRRARARA